MRIGFVGLRGINSWLYKPAVLKHPRTKLAAGCDPDAGAREKFTAETGAPAFPSLAEMASAVPLDGVMIGTPNPVHLPNIREVVACGLPMCVTKPLCNSVVEAREAVARCREAGLVLAVGHEYRFRPLIRAVRERLAAGELGRASFAQTHMGHQGGISKLTAAGTWRADKSNVPGGCANMLGVHCFDALNALFGEPVAVSAVHKRLISPSPLEDTTAAVIEYASGQVGVAMSSYASAASDWVHVYGTEANVWADTRAARLCLEKDGKVTDLPVPAFPESGLAVVDMFVRAVKDGIPPEAGGEAGLAAVAILEASIRSAELGRRVPLSELS